MGFPFPKNFRDRVANVIDDWEAFAKVLEEDSPVSIRINPEKLSHKPDLRPIPWHANGFYLEKRPYYTMDPLFHAGCYYPQEPGSMLLDHVLRQLPLDREDLHVLDLCAAPGGKSTLILDWLDGNGFLVSNEVIGKRARVLQENLDKWGHANRMVCNSDPQHFQKLGQVFDLIVIDAPCSGEGMFRKEADAVKMWSEEVVEHCHQRQNRILEDALRCLKPGGYIIYSTCTYNTRENEEVLAKVIEAKGVESVELDIPADWGISIAQRIGIHSYRCLPHRVKSEGFCISVLRFPGESNEKQQEGRNKKRGKQTNRSVDPVSLWLDQPDHFSSIEHRNQTYLVPVRYTSWALELSSKIHVLTIGLEAGRIIRGDLIPAAPLALSINLRLDAVSTTELSDDQIIDYLSKRDFQDTTAKGGWILCKYRGTPIGWAKAVAGKLKNHWPKEWRIVHEIKSNQAAFKQPLDFH